MKKKYLIIGITITIIFILVISICVLHPYLAVNDPVHSGILVIEGWISQEAITHAATVFNKEQYKGIILLDSNGENPGKTEKILFILNKNNIDDQQVHIVPLPPIDIHKTISSALVLKDWFKEHDPGLLSFDLFSETVHAQKSYMLFKKVFHPDIDVGIIAGRTNKYNVKSWFLSPTGIRLVLKSLAGVIDVIQTLDLTASMSNEP